MNRNPSRELSDTRKSPVVLLQINSQINLLRAMLGWDTSAATRGGVSYAHRPAFVGSNRSRFSVLRAVAYDSAFDLARNRTPQSAPLRLVSPFFRPHA